MPEIQWEVWWIGVAVGYILIGAIAWGFAAARFGPEDRLGRVLAAVLWPVFFALLLVCLLVIYLVRGLVWLVSWLLCGLRLLARAGHWFGERI